MANTNRAVKRNCRDDIAKKSQTRKLTLLRQCFVVLCRFCIAGVLVVLGLIPCQAKTSHGDAVLIHGTNPPSLPASIDQLILPDVSIGAKSSVRYRVLSLPQTIYPSGFQLEVPEDEDVRGRTQFPWQNCIIRASLEDLRGKAFFSRTINLGRDRLGSEPGKQNHRRILFLFTDYKLDGTTALPRHLSYQLHIDVIRPSSRSSDKLIVKAFAVLSRTN